MTVYAQRLCHCGQPVRKTVVYINRRNGKENRRVEMCDEHVGQELTLATTGLPLAD